MRSRFFSPYARGWIDARTGLMNASSGEVVSGMSADRFQRGPRGVELVLDNPPGGVQPVAQAGDAGGVCALEERRPERGAGERCLDIGQQLVDRVLVLAVLGSDLAHQPLSAWRRCHSHKYSSASGSGREPRL